MSAGSRSRLPSGAPPSAPERADLPAADRLDLLAELELFPDGRPGATDTSPVAALSWTLAEEPLPPARRHTNLLQLWQPVGDEETTQAAERWKHDASAPEPAPGQWQMEPATDEPRGAVRPRYVSVGVGRVSRLDSLVSSLQQRYRRLLDSLERDSLTRPPAEELRFPLPPAAESDDEPPETPGSEQLDFARTCLEQLNLALLTGPFNYLPELEEPADLLRAALRRLVSTAAALHHELELRSMALSRHRLLQQALRKRLQLQYQQRVSEVVTDVRARRQLDMERLSGQIELNVALVQKLGQYVSHAERLSAGRGRVQRTYIKLVELTNMKRQEILMYRSLLVDTSEHKKKLRSQMKIMRKSIAQHIRSESLHQLLSEQFIADTEAEMIILQDDVTQTQAEVDEKKKQLRRTVLRRNKAVQLDRRLRQRTESLVKELRRLDVLTTDAEQGMETSSRSLETLTQRWSEVHEKVQTARLSLTNTIQLLDDQVLEQLEMEEEVAEMDIGPLIQELNVLEEELKMVKQKEHEARVRHADLRRRRQTLSASRNKLRVTVADTLDSISGALKDMDNMEGDHKTVMTLLREQMELNAELLRAARLKWAELSRIQGIVELDLDTMKAKGDGLHDKLVTRQEETNGILVNIRTLTVGALRVLEMLRETREEEQDIVQHLQVVVAELQDKKEPVLQKAQARLDELSAQTERIQQLKERRTEQLADQRTRTEERASEVAKLQRLVDEMEVRKQHQEKERAELIQKRQLKTRQIADFRDTVQQTQSSYAELSGRLSQEEVEQEQLIVKLRSWCRQVALCNGGYSIEIARMQRELRAFYEQLERHVRQETELGRRKMAEADTELRQLTELHNQKHAASLDRDWQLRAALLASSQAAERSLKPVQKAMAGLDAERRKLVKMVATAVNMRPFSRVEMQIEQAVCPLPEEQET